MKLDHATIVTPHLEAVRHFFLHIVGLTEGTRPPFSFEGHWLYQDDKPIIHLIKSYSNHPPAKTPSRIDHIAFRVADETEWNALTTRLQEEGIASQTAEVPATGERQLFVVPTPGVAIEFVITSRRRPIKSMPD
ncbi:MAG TPA: VOC family protein [Herminiimonas sp.]|jgi:catechol 2,3-dioxygenase-like lactoylglutathione lyase family enzyme|nr:VOC family protein [Herminiimonas sp.]